MRQACFAVAAAFGCLGTASAQSTVKLYGTLDLALKVVKNDGSARRLSETQDGLNRSALGFTGTEDLGDGLKAGFVLEASVGTDVGGIGTGTSRNKFFDRNSFVRLSNRFGEIRLGRDYVPTFWNNVIFDAMGGVPGVGGSLNISRNVGGLTVPGGVGSVTAINTFSRADNAISYWLPPNIGGFYGQLLAAAAEGGTGGDPNLGRVLGGRLGYSAGPATFAAAYSQTKGSAAGRPDYIAWNLGGSYDFKFLKLMGIYSNERNEVPVFDVQERRYTLSTSIPVGLGEIHASWGRSMGSPGPTAEQYAVGYVYNLSKRTALYTAASLLNNKDRGTFSVGVVPTAMTAFPTPGGKSRGADFGIRHFF